MRLIKIKTLENGAHDNQTINGVAPSSFPVPDGWAVDRNNLCVENFPFGEVVAEEIDGVMTVTKWTPGEIPEPEPKPEPEPTELEQLRADVDYIAMETGVKL